jgi:UDP-glucose 4-epimerase
VAPEIPYKKAVILGAAGFIGVNLARALAAKGFTLVCFDKVASPQWPSGVKSVVGDFTAPPDELMGELDDALVFHLVSASKPLPSTSQAGDEVAVDLAGTLRFLEATKGRNLRWVFFSSGGTVYGQNDAGVIAETSATEPICSYGIIKLTLERYFALYGKLHGVDHVIVRPANPYGPWQSPFQGQGLIAALLHKALNNETIEIWGDGENVRDYIYIDDMVAGAIAAAVSGHRGEIYNIGTGQGHFIKELIALIGPALGCPMNVVYAPARSVDVRRNVLCSDKLMAHTGWTPSTALAEGVVLTADWMRRTLMTGESARPVKNKIAVK